MNKIYGIALNTFRESIRQKLLAVALVFGVIFVASMYVLAPLAVGAKDKIVTDVGLAAISIIGVLAAILVGSSLVHKEVEKRAIFMVLTRPVPRYQYLVGKFAGIVAALALMMAAMTALMAVTASLGSGILRPAVLAAVYLSVLEVTVMCAVVIFFSTLTSPILTSFFALCCFVAGSLSNDLRLFAEKFGGAGLRLATEIVHVLLPNLAVFNLRHEAVHGLPFRRADLLAATAYALVYCGVALYFAYLVFRRREFS